jgi:excinuclease ABC subunit A
LSESINTAMHHGENVLMVLDQILRKYVTLVETMCPTTGISYQNPEPNLFLSTLQKECDHCKGLGTVNEINTKKIIPNPKLSIKAGGFAPWRIQIVLIFKQLKS